MGGRRQQRAGRRAEKGSEQSEAEGRAIAAANAAVAKKPAGTKTARGEPHGASGRPGAPVRTITDPEPVTRSAPAEDFRIRLSAFTPATIDDENRTVRATLGTEDACTSINMRTRQPVYEVYLMSGMEPVEQVPLCDTHKRDSVDRLKGSVRNIAVVGDHFDGDLCVDPVEEAAWSKIRNRHLRDVSAGFEPLQSTIIKAGQTGSAMGRSFTAPKDRPLEVHTRWRLRETSLTPIGSDSRAKIRNQAMPSPLFEEEARFNPNHDEKGMFASAEGSSASAAKASAKAEKAGSGARSKEAKGKAATAHAKAAAAHTKAAAFHKSLAQYHKSQGHAAQAKAHFAAAKGHREAASEHRGHVGREFANELHIRLLLSGDSAVNETLRTWLEENLQLRAEATAEEAQTFWDTLSEADRTRAAEACRADDDDEDDDEDDDDDDDDDDTPAAKKKADKKRAAEEALRVRSAASIEAVRGEALEEGRQAELHRQERIRSLAGSDVPAEVRDRAIAEGWKMGRVQRVFLAAVRDARSPSVGGGGNTDQVEMVRSLFGAAGGDNERGPAVHVRNHEADCTVGTLAASLLTRSYTGSQDPCDLLGGYQPGASMVSEETGKPEVGRAYYVRPDVQRMISGRTRKASDERRKLAERLLDLGDRYRGMGPMDIVDECNRIEGRTRTTYDKEERVRAALSGSALSAIFTQSISAKFLGGYIDAVDSTQGWVTETDVPNFLTNERAIYGKFGVLKKLGKGSTAEDLDTTDWNEVYKIFRYAAKFAVDEQDFINDRFGAIEQMTPQDMGLAARATRPNVVYAILLSNPTLGQDGYSVFDATHHNNVITGQITDFGAGVASANPGPIQDAASAMGKQRLRNRVLNLRPRYIIGGTDMQVAFNRLYAPQNLNVTISGSGTIYNPDTPNKDTTQVVCDGRLDPLGCYDNDTTKTFYPYTTTGTTAGRSGMAILAARPGEQGAKTVEVGYRIGTGLRLRIRAGIFREGEGRWGMSWDVNLDIGAKTLDFRGLVLLTGGGSQQAASEVNSQT